MTLLFDGSCEVCLGTGDHYDWCPILIPSAFAPAAPDQSPPARASVGAAGGDDRVDNRARAITPDPADRAADTAQDGA